MHGDKFEMSRNAQKMRIRCRRLSSSAWVLAASLCLLAWCSLLPTVNAIIVLTVEPFEEECMIVRTPKSSTVSGNFELVDDELPSDPVSILLVDVTDKYDKVLFRSPRKRYHGKFSVKVDGARRLTLCVQNGINWVQKRGRGAKNAPRETDRGDHIDGIDRLVSLSVRVRLRDEVTEIHDQHEGILEDMEDMHDSLADLVSHHENLRTREAKHRTVVESTFTRLMQFTLLEAFFLVLVALLQVWYLRRFLEQRRYV